MSTRFLSRARRLLTVTTLAWAATSVPVAAAELVSPAQAIARAVTGRFGEAVTQVTVESVITTVTPQASLVAVPDPAAVVGRQVRFTLLVNGQRRGTAVATVRARAMVARAVKSVERGERIAADVVAISEADLEGQRFSKLLRQADVVGSRARRAIDPGVVVSRSMVTTPFDVQNGDRVTVGVTVGRVHITGEGLASGSGFVGDVVRVMQPGRRAMLKARITERGVVEVMP